MGHGTAACAPRQLGGLVCDSEDKKKSRAWGKSAEIRRNTQKHPIKDPKQKPQVKIPSKNTRSYKKVSSLQQKYSCWLLLFPIYYLSGYIRLNSSVIYSYSIRHLPYWQLQRSHMFRASWQRCSRAEVRARP